MRETSSSSGSGKKYTILVGLVAIVAAHYYLDLKAYVYDNLLATSTVTASASSTLSSSSNEQDEIKRNIIRSWSRFIQPPLRSFDRNVKFAIGVNTNVDLIVPAVGVFDKLKTAVNSTSSELLSINHHNFKNLSQFLECFGYFFRKGSAAERSFINQLDFEAVINASTSLDHQQWFIGGNAALMAQGISQRFGGTTDVLLVGPVGPRLKQLLDERVRVGVDSLIDKDEIHLILEYGVGDWYEKWTAPHANRFIVSHDWYNSRMELMDEFFKATSVYQPDIVVLAGLHLLESQDEQFRVDKLRRLATLLSQEERKHMTHLELASIGDKSLMIEIVNERIIERVDSLGLNEQELLFLAHSFGDDSKHNPPHSDYYTEIDGQPEIYKVVDIIDWVLNTFGATTTTTSNRKLSRVHFHSLTFHLIAELESSSSSSSMWSNTVASLLAGAKVASKQACGLDYESDDHDLLSGLLELKLPYKKTSNDEIVLFKVNNDDDSVDGGYVSFNTSTPFLEFTRDGGGGSGRVRFLFTPVLVCKKPAKTVGLGDAISSTGLYYAAQLHV